jgi:hypothetical protein
MPTTKEKIIYKNGNTKGLYLHPICCRHCVDDLIFSLRMQKIDETESDENDFM